LGLDDPLFYTSSRLFGEEGKLDIELEDILNYLEIYRHIYDFH
jgi:hypothetical protein